MDAFLSNKTAVVTGGTRGIGYAISLELARAGASVVLCGRNQEAVDAAVVRLRDEAGPDGGSIDGIAADVSKWDQVESMFQFVSRKWNRLDILVNNAGVGIFKPVADLEPNEWHKVIDLNLSGLYYCCHAAMPLLRQSGDAYVFNISSLAGRNPFAGGAAYNASKFGVNGFTEAMMLDHRQEGIRVTTVMPGSVATGFGHTSGHVSPHAAGAGSEAKRELGDEWKIQSKDIAEVVTALLRLPPRTLVSRVEIRPSKPPK